MIRGRFSCRLRSMRILRALSVASFVAIAALSTLGCGAAGDAKTANITPGNMPDGESWTGVYYHPVYGYMHIVEQDTNVIGKWKRTDQSHWGQLSGTKQGNVLHFTWTEHIYCRSDPSSISKGRGVFVYKVGKEGIAETDGQFGLDDSEVGGDWHMVKQQRQAPELNNIPGNVPCGAGGGGVGGALD